MAEQNQFRCPVCYTVSELDPEEYKFEDDPRALKEKIMAGTFVKVLMY
tara:strand:- start:89 stop:232 length:144 start_codon:yes stop_codon:yes gene_type:complete